jgi:hypothetical protein
MPQYPNPVRCQLAPSPPQWCGAPGTRRSSLPPGEPASSYLPRVIKIPLKSRVHSKRDLGIRALYPGCPGVGRRWDTDRCRSMKGRCTNTGGVCFLGFSCLWKKLLKWHLLERSDHKRERLADKCKSVRLKTGKEDVTGPKLEGSKKRGRYTDWTMADNTPTHHRHRAQYEAGCQALR